MQAELLEADRSVVVVIDLQGKLAEMAWRSQMVLAATRRLMQLAEIFGRPVLLTEQYPEGLGGTHPEVREVFDSLTVPKRYLSKVSFGCCGEPAFAGPSTSCCPACRPGGARSWSPGSRHTSACCRRCSSCCAPAARSTSAGSA